MLYRLNPFATTNFWNRIDQASFFAESAGFNGVFNWFYKVF